MKHENQFLPDALPSEPFGLFLEWFDVAQKANAQPNANAMVLATIDADARPAARVVLCKQVVSDPGYIVFFTNYLSHKGEQLTNRPHAAVVFHWDTQHRQVRMSGPVVRSPDEESDRYFASRQVDSRIGAWASHQSQPLSSRAELARRVEEMRGRFNIRVDALDGYVPRPPHWGGFRLWPDSVELWVEGAGRVHDRALWTRVVEPNEAFTMKCGAWSATRLNP
jgi:pyridoxamine 5'-phosphate oxidase